MYWQDTEETECQYRSDRVVDAAFRMACTHLPADHAYLFLKSVETFLPWLSSDGESGIHALHGADLGSGWPQPEESAIIHLSRRVRLILRIPRERLEECGALGGKTLSIADAEVRLGDIKVRELSPAATLFARRTITGADEAEERFLARVDRDLERLGVVAPKRLPGRLSRIGTPNGNVYARSLLLADVPPPDSIRIQESGLGEGRALGCGLFVPHKSIAAVRGAAD